MKRPTHLCVAAILALAAVAVAAGIVAFALSRRDKAPAGRGDALFTTPPADAPPRFRLPAGKKVLVLPDDMLDPLSHPPAKRALAETVNRLLTERRAAGSVVPYEELNKLASGDPEYKDMAVSTVGKKLGAELVVYVGIGTMTLKDPSATALWRGRFSARVRVVDVDKGRLWPEDSAGHELEVTEWPTEDASPGYDAKLARRLADRLAQKIAALFCDRPERP